MTNELKLDVMFVGVHPDDVELGAGGTICKLVNEGKKVGIIDMTRGELGSRGSAEIRDKEAQTAGNILGLSARENLRMRDGFFDRSEKNQLKIIQAIRKFRPEVLITNAPDDRHPDHGRASKLVRDSAFLAGLKKIDTGQSYWRPKRTFFFIQDYHLTPSFVVDIGNFWEQKMEAIAAYSSQFFNPTYQAEKREEETYISSKNFWDFLDARAQVMGHMVGVRYGEGFISETPLLAKDLLCL